MKCLWCGQEQPAGQTGRCQLCAQVLGTQYSTQPAAPPVESPDEAPVDEVTVPPRRKRKWPLVLLMLLVAGIVYYFLDLPIPFLGEDDVSPTPAATSETPENLFQFPNLPEGATDCHNGVAVGGGLTCDFGAAVSHGLRLAGGVAAVDGDTIIVPAVEDAVREIEVDVPCTIGKPTVCALGTDEKVYINR